MLVLVVVPVVVPVAVDPVLLAALEVTPPEELVAAVEVEVAPVLEVAEDEVEAALEEAPDEVAAAPEVAPVESVAPDVVPAPAVPPLAMWAPLEPVAPIEAGGSMVVDGAHAGARSRTAAAQAADRDRIDIGPLLRTRASSVQSLNGRAPLWMRVSSAAPPVRA